MLYDGGCSGFNLCTALEGGAHTGLKLFRDLYVGFSETIGVYFFRAVKWGKKYIAMKLEFINLSKNFSFTVHIFKKRTKGIYRERGYIYFTTVSAIVVLLSVYTSIAILIKTKASLLSSSPA